jgi:MFS family permease
MRSTPSVARPERTKLSRDQIVGFWTAWGGWTLDGMDSVVYALVMAPALTELLPHTGIAATGANVASYGSILFAVFLIGWGLSFLWGPIADRFGRAKTLAATILVFAVFTGAAGLAQNVWQLGFFRLMAGVGIGGEWALAGTYVAESWPEDRRKMGAGYLQTGYYAGFFLAAILNFTVGVRFGWRAMFLCGLAPVVVAIFAFLRLKDPGMWMRHAREAQKTPQLKAIFNATYRRRTVVNASLAAVAITGLWAGAVYEPTAIITLARQSGMAQPQAVRMASFGTGILSMGTIIGCLFFPVLAERIGRKRALALYFAGMMVAIVAAFRWAFYLPNGLVPFLAVLFFLGLAGGNFTAFSLWLPEQYETRIRATAFAFATSFGRFVGAAVNFIIAGAVRNSGSLGVPVAWTALAFVFGLFILPFAKETKGKPLSE